ncbi:MAG: hypothetical protein CL672_07005 [Balneola sp.]|nr:hypothetical protein [Balneola sp.]
MSKMPIYSFETQEIYDKHDIYLVAFEIMNDNRVNYIPESLKYQVLAFSQQYTDSMYQLLNDRELHYYFYSTGAKIPPFSKIDNYEMVENLLWVDVKSFDSPLLEWTNKFDSVGSVYEWKLD